MSLPPLRADLQLSAAAPGHDGAPQWTLADPLRGRYFKLGAVAVRLLQHWYQAEPQRVLSAANAEPGPAADAQALEELLLFLGQHDLLSAEDTRQRDSYATKAAATRQSLWTRVLHQYLFFRIPLWRPDAFLNRAWPLLERHGGWLLRIFLPLVLALGVFLVIRDWSRFIATFPHLFSLGGILAFGVALGFAKLCHEFGHAFMAKRAGCRVQSMGLAFMVLLPMFYTDVSDAWRVRDRRSRLLIDAGGVFAELVLAVLALLAWSLLPDGPARTAAFMLASATWITTLLVNLNPFMRFDGYFLVSDLWGVENLQQRAFALCRWRLREALFGYGEPAPEAWPPVMRRRLLVWGYGAWLWRAVLFFGIALAVYHLFFKVLGIFLMLVELVWFIGLPVWKELQQWWLRRGQAAPGKTLRVAAGLALLLTVLVVPWRGAVDVPAMLEASRVSTLHAPVAARVKSLLVREGQKVGQGPCCWSWSRPTWRRARPSCAARSTSCSCCCAARPGAARRRAMPACSNSSWPKPWPNTVAWRPSVSACNCARRAVGYCATCRLSWCPASGSARPRRWGGLSSRACACGVTWPKPTCGGWRPAAKGALSPMTRRGRQCRYGWSKWTPPG